MFVIKYEKINFGVATVLSAGPTAKPTFHGTQKKTCLFQQPRDNPSKASYPVRGLSLFFKGIHLFGQSSLEGQIFLLRQPRATIPSFASTVKPSFHSIQGQNITFQFIQVQNSLPLHYDGTIIPSTLFRDNPPLYCF
jgi:hypothetical protein